MKCSKCGNIISDNAEFCPVCGEPTAPAAYDNGGATFRQRSANGAQPRNYQPEPVYDDGYAEQDGYAEDEAYYEDEEPAPRSNRAMIGVLIAMGVIIVILVIVLVSILFSNKNKNPSTPANTPAATDSATTDAAATTLPGASAAATTQPGASSVVTTLPGESVVVTTLPGESAAVTTALTPATTSPTEGRTPGNFVVSTEGDNLNIRKGPGTDYDIVGRIPNGTAVTAYTNGGSWAYVTYGGVSGYISTSYLKAVTG